MTVEWTHIVLSLTSSTIATTPHWSFGALNCSHMMCVWVNVYDFVIQLWSQKTDKKNCYLRCHSGLLRVVCHNMTMLDFKWSNIKGSWWQFNLNQNTNINIIIVDAILIFVYCRPMSTKHLTSTVHLSNPSCPWTVCFFACYCHIVCLW